MNNDKKTIVVWFSCGAASAVAAKKTIELYGNTHVIRIVNNPVKNEDVDNQRFAKDVEKWLGVKIETAVNEKYPNCDVTEVFEQRKFMSGINGAPCTTELKKKARQKWEQKNHFDSMVLGFTVDEIKRHERFISIEPYPLLPILINLKLSKQDCFDILAKEGIEIPQMYKLGFPNANCIGCVKASSATYWSLVREHFPQVFQDRMEQSDRLGCRLTYYKGSKAFLSELPEGYKGNKLKKFDFPDCGIFCELDDKTAKDSSGLA